MHPGYLQLGPTGKRLVSVTGDGTGIMPGRLLMTPPTAVCCCQGELADYYVDFIWNVYSDEWFEHVNRFIPSGWNFHSLSRKPQDRPECVWWIKEHTTLTAAIALWNTTRTWPTVDLPNLSGYPVAGWGSPEPAVQGDGTFLVAQAQQGGLGTVARLTLGVAFVKVYRGLGLTDEPCEAIANACETLHCAGDACSYYFDYATYDFSAIDVLAVWYQPTTNSSLWGGIAAVMGEGEGTMTATWPGWWPDLAALLAETPSPLYQGVLDLEFHFTWTSLGLAGVGDYWCNGIVPAMMVAGSYARKQDEYIRAAYSRHMGAAQIYSVEVGPTTASVLYTNGPFQIYRGGIGGLCAWGGPVNPPDGRPLCQCEVPPYPQNCSGYPFTEPPYDWCLTPPFTWTDLGADNYYEGLRFGVFPGQ